MEYVENGSLEELLKRRGKLSVNEAVDLFRDIAIGLLQRTAKAYCTAISSRRTCCWIKIKSRGSPILDNRGCRMSKRRHRHAILHGAGTSQPERDARRALGRVCTRLLLYCMLTGSPPYRNNDAITEIETAADLDERLTRYREVIQRSARPARHRSVAGVDRALIEIVDNCLAVDRNLRYANIQAVLDALDAREQRRARRPLVVLGAVGPALILAIMAIFAWQSFESILNESDRSSQTASPGEQSIRRAVCGQDGGQ